jgi:hypothetical protein
LLLQYLILSPKGMVFTLKPSYQEKLAVWLLALALVFGSGYLILVNHDAGFASDEHSYLAMARGDLNVPVTHRYRVLLPLLAQGIALMLQMLLALVNGAAYGHLPLGTAFFLVNSFLMASSGLVLYQTARFAGASRPAGLIAMAGILTSAYATYITGLALTDSFYFFTLAFLFYAVLSAQRRLLLLALLLGPLAKESFWMFLPFILLASRFMPWPRLLAQLALAAGIFWGLHAAVDYWAGPASGDRLENIGRHVVNVKEHFFKIASFRGLQGLGSTYGIFYLLLPVAWWQTQVRVTWFGFKAVACLVFLLVVVGHLLLSGEAGRMWFFSAPVFAVLFAKCIDLLPVMKKVAS